MRDIVTIMQLTLRELRCSRILWAAAVLGLLFVALYGVGFFFIRREIAAQARGPEVIREAGFNFVIMAGMYVVSFLGVMLGVLLSVGALSAEISTHTVHSLAAKPIRRSAVILGKWLSLALLLLAYVFLLGSGMILVTWAISGYLLPRALAGLLLVALQAEILLSLGILGGTRLPTVANGVVVFMCYGLAFIGGWIEQIGSLTSSQTAVDIGIATSLLVPSEAMWKLAASLMHPPITRMVDISPFSMVSTPSPAMLIYALLYTAAAVALAVRSFGRRDL